MKNLYKRRKANGTDVYGQFKDGRQLTADKIAGATVWHEFKAGDNA